MLLGTNCQLLCLQCFLLFLLFLLFFLFLELSFWCRWKADLSMSSSPRPYIHCCSRLHCSCFHHLILCQSLQYHSLRNSRRSGCQHKCSLVRFDKSTNSRLRLKCSHRHIVHFEMAERCRSLMGLKLGSAYFGLIVIREVVAELSTNFIKYQRFKAPAEKIVVYLSFSLIMHHRRDIEIANIYNSLWQ